jgi:hypothetical protein
VLGKIARYALPGGGPAEPAAPASARTPERSPRPAVAA